MLDLYGSSREELIALLLAERDRCADLEQQVARQQAEIATLRTVIAQVTERVGELLATSQTGEPPPDDMTGGAAGPAGMPGLKPGSSPARPVRPRKQRARGFARRRMAPTRRADHAVATCPHCQIPLHGGTLKRTREVIEAPVVPAIVTEHRYLERRCPGCGQHWVPEPGLDGVVCGQSRLGIGLVSLIATLREEARLPFGTIQWDLRTVPGLGLSVGAIVAAGATVAAAAQVVIARIRAAIRASPIVHADETGWRENGGNGYVWTCSTPTDRYFVRGGRDKGVLEAMLGEVFGGVLASDFYGASTQYDGLHQYCWAHLLRDIHELRERHRQDAGVQGWADAVHQLFTRAQAFASPDPRARRRAQQAFQGDLLALCQPYLGDAVAPPTKLCRRMEKHLAELFVFVAEPAVPATNNAAERSLRHLVTSRKISGGTRSAAGSATKLTLASLFGTWRAQGRNPLSECRQLLAAPQV